MDYDTLITQARDEAKRYHHKYIRTEHLLLALLRLGWLELSEANIKCLYDAVAVMRCPICSADEKMELSASAVRAYQLAETYAGDGQIDVEHVVLGLLQSSLTVSRLLASCDMNGKEWMQSLESKLSDG